MRREFLKVFGLGGAAAALGGCLGNTIYTYRQKLTVVVSSPDGEKSGSAVTEVTASVGSQGLSPANVAYSVRGEATVVDLGKGKYLFALLSSGGNYLPTEYWAMNAFYKRVMEEYPSGSEERMHKFYTALQSIREPQRLTPDLYPLMVTFADVTNPKTVKEVKPGKFTDTFGPSFHLKSVTLEITDEKVTVGNIEALLPWSSSMAGSIGKDMKLPYDHILNQIDDGSFKRGL